jgi:RNA polymerase sigma factor (TIGR02999 family)
MGPKVQQLPVTASFLVSFYFSPYAACQVARGMFARRVLMGSTTASFSNAAEGTYGASGDTLFGTLYFELRRLARRELARQWEPASMSVTTLLHEAYLNMAEREGSSFPDHARFMGYAARVMRGLIIDHARSRHAIKRGAGFEITSFDTQGVESPADAKELSSISDALDELARVEPTLAEVVDLKFFCGFSFAEIAALQKLSERTVQRRWEKARIYLHRSIRADWSR